MPEKPEENKSMIEKDFLKNFFGDPPPASPKTVPLFPVRPEPVDTAPDTRTDEKKLKDFIFSSDTVIEEAVKNRRDAVPPPVSKPAGITAVTEKISVATFPEAPVRVNPAAVTSELPAPAVEPPVHETVHDEPAPAAAPASSFNMGALIAGFFAVMAILLVLGVFWHRAINRAHRTESAKSAAAPAALTVSPAPAADPVLAELNRLSPDGVLISYHQIKNGQLMLKGSVRTQASLAQFIGALNASARFKNAYIATLRAEGENSFTFKIYADADQAS